MRNRTVFFRMAAVFVAMLAIAACSGATPDVRTITVTFVRNAESESNADDILNTEVPGPELTEKGQKQSEQLGHQLSRNNYDGIYASSMTRAEQTAVPLSKQLGRQVQVLPGLREIDAGWFDGKPTSISEEAYLIAPNDWLQYSDRTNAIPGSVDGNTFNDEFTGAVQKIYDSGNSKPVAFSHGTAIMTWTLMNVKNCSNNLMADHPLPHIGRVVISGSPVTGWKLVDWDGIRKFN